MFLHEDWYEIRFKPAGEAWIDKCITIYTKLTKIMKSFHKLETTGQVWRTQHGEQQTDLLLNEIC